MIDPDLREAQLDAQLRTGLKRSLVRVGLIGAALIAGAVLALVLVGPSTPLVALAAVFAVMLLLALEIVVRVPRPHPRVVDGQVVVRNARVFGAAGTLMGVLATIAVVGLLADPDILDQRRAGVLLLAVVVGLITIVGGAALIWRPGTVLVTPEGVGTVRLLERRAWIGWDDIGVIGVPDDLTTQQVAALPLAIRVRTR